MKELPITVVSTMILFDWLGFRLVPIRHGYNHRNIAVLCGGERHQILLQSVFRVQMCTQVEPPIYRKLAVLPSIMKEFGARVIHTVVIANDPSTIWPLMQPYIKLACFHQIYH